LQISNAHKLTYRLS